MKRSVCALLLLLVLSSSAWAKDIISTWIDNNGNPMKLSYRDDKHIRMDSGKEGYMLIVEEKVYMVTQENGQQQAFDMDQMAGMMKAFGQSAAQSVDSETNRQHPKFKNTGRTESVAGYKGKVYLVEEEQDDGSMKAVEIVLSTHADIKSVNQGWIALSKRMGKMLGEEMAQSIEQAVSQSQKEGYGGLLRYSDALKLGSVEKATLKDDHFKLPEGAALVQMPQFSIEAARDAAESAPQTTNSATDSKNTTETAPETDRNASDQLKEELDKGVRNLFKKLF